MNIDVPMSKKWFSRYVNATVITGTMYQGSTERTSSRPFLFTINDGLNEQETLQSNVPFLFMATRFDFAIDYCKSYKKAACLPFRNAFSHGAFGFLLSSK